MLCKDQSWAEVGVSAAETWDEVGLDQRLEIQAQHFLALKHAKALGEGIHSVSIKSGGGLSPFL